MNGHLGLPWFAFRKQFLCAPDDGATAASPAPAPIAAPVAPASDAPQQAGEKPRDTKGRYTKENIERAAGLTPETPAAPAPAAAAPVAETPKAPEAATPAPDADLTALDAFLSTAVPLDATPAPATPEAAAPAVTQQQQQPAIPPEVLSAAQMAQRIDEAATRGDAAAVLGMFDQRVIDALTDHIYRQNAEAFAQRFANEAQGIQQDPRLDVLSRQFAEFQQALQQRQQNEEQQRTQAQQARTLQAAQVKAQAHIDGLFKTVNLADSPHRAWIESRMLSEVGKVKNAPQNIVAGRYGDINKVFRELYVQFRPLLQASASPAQPAPQPSGAAALMQSASSGATTTVPGEVPLVEGGKISGRGIVTRLKDYMKNAG
jgi:hypothetical protein